MEEINLEKGYYLLVKKHKWCFYTRKGWDSPVRLLRFDNSAEMEEEFDCIMCDTDAETSYTIKRFVVED